MIKSVRRIAKNVVYSILKVYATFYPTKKNSIFFLPHPNCIQDKYDIINYTADNVLVLFNEIIRDAAFSDYTLYLGYYDNNLVGQYQQYISSSGLNIRVILVDINSKIRIARTIIKCSIIVTDHPHHDIPYKSYKQKTISLGYFTPFKDDFWDIKRLPIKKRRELRKAENKSFDYHIVTSQLSGRIISIDTLLEFDKFISLGFPRNDIFYRDNTAFREKLEKAININFKKIICYTPTFRDYERSDLYLSDNSLVERKGIFGPVTPESSEMMEEMLERQQAIIIAKMHPWQENSILDTQKNNRIFMFSDIAERLRCSLYDVLSVSDSLITDYTSTAFDFMHRGKPIIYYFYDYDKYTTNRGFSFEPVDSVCGGPVVYTFLELIECVDAILNKEDDYAQKRTFVHTLMNEHHDGESSKRIKSFIKKIVDGEN